MTKVPMLIEIERKDDVCIVRLSGGFASGIDLDYLRAKAEEIRSLTCLKVLADVREVLYMGSSAIGFIVGIYSSVTKNPGGRFVMAGAMVRVQHVFELTRLSGVIPTAPDISAGLAMLHARAVASGTAV